MAKKTAMDLIKAKQARQKKIAIGGAVLLVVIGVVEGPSMLKRLHGGGGGQVPAWLAASRAQATGAAPPPGVSLAAPSLAGGNPTGTTTAAAPTGLAAADVAPTAGPGQLASFSRFESKDPFAVQVPAGTKSSVPPPPTPTVTAPTGLGGSSGNGGGSATSGGAPGVTTPKPPAPVYTSAVIAVNGTLGTVDVGTDFGTPLGQPAGSAQPLFHLVSVSAHSAKIAIAGGSYANGSKTIALDEGKPLILQNTADGTRYTLKLYPQGTQVTGTTTTGAGAGTSGGVGTSPIPVPLSPGVTSTTNG